MIKLDGWITIGIKLNTDKFDKQMSELENKIDSEEKKQELLNSKTKEYEQDLENATRQVNELAKEYEKATEKAEQLRDAMKNAPKGSFERTQLTGEYNEQVKKVDQLSNALDKAETTQSRLQSKVNQTKLQYENSSKAIDKLRGKIGQINLKRQQLEFKQVERNVNNISKGITSTIGKIGKMALAVFGVRSAFAMLRQASSNLSQYNEQYATDLEYIRYALSSGIAPILEKIVSLAQTLMAYINYLSKAWFGKTIFASAKDFEKMKNSASGIAKSTKEIKNSLASFDEINVLGKSGGDGGASAGAISPSIDFGNIEDIQIPEWLTKISGILKNGFKSISDGVVNVWNGMWNTLKRIWERWGEPIFENLKTAVGRIGELFRSLWDNFLEPIWENLIKAIDWLWNNHLKLLLDNTLDLFTELINGILKIWNKTLAPFLTWMVDTFGPILADIINVIVNMFGSIVGAISDVVNGIITVLKGIIEFVVGVFTGDWEKAWQGVKDIFKGIWQVITGIVKGAINLIIDFINGMIAGIEKALNWIVEKINSLEIINPFTGDEIWSPNIPRFEFGRIPKLARGGIIAKPTQAIIGEAGREAVMPLDNNTEWMDLLADKLSDKISTGTGNQEVVIRFEGTMAQFVRSLKPQIEIENRRAGARIISGGAY